MWEMVATVSFSQSGSIVIYSCFYLKNASQFLRGLILSSAFRNLLHSDCSSNIHFRLASYIEIREGISRVCVYMKKKAGFNFPFLFECPEAEYQMARVVVCIS